MEACLEIYGFYRPIIKRTIVGMLCVAILTGAVFSRKAVGTKEYLSAEKQEETRNDIAVSKMEKIVAAESQEIIVSEPDKTVMAEAATPFLIDEAGMLYGINEEMLDCKSGVLELPSENCVGIRSHAFINGFTDIYEIYIPSNISVIETGAFDGIDNLFDIMVEEGNINYTSIDGVLYDEEEITLLAFPAGRTGGYIVPTQTERIAANAFAQTGLSVIDIRDCGTLLIEDDRAAQLVRCEQ